MAWVVDPENRDMHASWGHIWTAGFAFGLLSVAAIFLMPVGDSGAVLAGFLCGMVWAGALLLLGRKAYRDSSGWRSRAVFWVWYVGVGVLVWLVASLLYGRVLGFSGLSLGGVRNSVAAGVWMFALSGLGCGFFVVLLGRLGYWSVR